MRDRAMQLLNNKLFYDNQSLTHIQISPDYLNKFVEKLNGWIIPTQKKDEVSFLFLLYFYCGCI